MPVEAVARIAQVIQAHFSELLDNWLGEQHRLANRRDLIPDAELHQQSAELLSSLRDALAEDPTTDIGRPNFALVREALSRISSRRAQLGFNSAETATFVFSLKQPLFALLQTTANHPRDLATETWEASLLVDRLGLFTVDVSEKGRGAIIARQQQEILELSTPVVRLWEGILTLPLIGTLDSARTQVVMENLLQEIVVTGSDIAIIDITGVPTVDTLVAQHLLKTVAAARLMGADCIISGIRPQIAQTIVHLGVDLTEVTTKATLADAFRLALQRRGLSVTPPRLSLGRNGSMETRL